MNAGSVSHGTTTHASTSGRDALGGLSRANWHRFYRTMLLSRRLDDKEIQLKNQSKSYFQISGAGHEAIQVAAGMAMRPGYDWFFPYYRDRALCLTLGVTAHDMLLAAVGAASDPSSGGRQMPNHWSSPDLHIVSPSSATTTQCLHAVGAAEAGEFYQRAAHLDGLGDAQPDEVAYVSLGDGATSEGEFWESLNTACSGRLPVVFLVEDNGYAISVPVDVQTPGGDIARLLETFPSLEIIRVDGTDPVASLDAMTRAVSYTRSRSGPVLVKASVIRPYSHSLSDDEGQYKSQATRDEEATRDPIDRCADLLKMESLASDDDLTTLAADVDREIHEAAERALAAAKPDPATTTLYLYSPTVDPTSATFDATPVAEGAPVTMVAAINRTLKDEMAADPRILVFGEDVADSSQELLSEVKGKGGVFKATLGLQREYAK